MQVQYFYNEEPDLIDEDITKWLEQHKDISIFDIKQTALPPDRIILNPEHLYRDDRIERAPYMVVSIWYTRR